MTPDDHRELREHLKDLLAAHGVSEAANVVERQARFDSIDVTPVVEFIIVHLPHAASALGGIGIKALADGVVDYAKKKMQPKATGAKRTVTILGADGKPISEVELPDVPKK